MNAIQDATKCVTPRSSRTPNAEDVAASLNYLNMLASILEEHSYCDWDDAKAPTSSPPDFHAATNSAPDLAYYAHGGYYQPQESPPAMIAVPSTTSSSWNTDASSSANRYATFQNDEESSDDESTRIDDDEAGDVFPPSPLASSNPSVVHLSMRRIMIRVVTAQSEVYACQASQSPPQWQHGADLYQVSLLKIHQALEFADSECAKWLHEGNALPKSLKEDADVVAVAIQYLNTQMDKFIKKALAKQEYLLKKLQPQWQTRDKMKQKWGSERWTNNPHPKRNFAELRARDEEQLRQVQAALESLDNVDTTRALQCSQQLQQQVVSFGKNKQPKRDNGKRPSPNQLKRRVALSEYPDACEFGWIFTGSGGGDVEYFENEDGVKLDWYFTTASVKTFVNVPGTKRQQVLFGISTVTPIDYLEILLNPRGHTNEALSNNNQKAHPNERKSSRNLWMPHD